MFFRDSIIVRDFFRHDELQKVIDWINELVVCQWLAENGSSSASVTGKR